jgi:hypothetical protein
VELIFHDIGDDDGQFGHLMTQRIGVVARQRLAATAAGEGLARDGLVDLLRGNQQTLVLRMARLTAAFLAGLVGSGWWATFAVKAIRRRGQRGIGGIGPQLGASIGQMLLELLDLLLLLMNNGLEVFDLNVKAADSGFEFVDLSLRIGGFEFGDAPAEKTQILPHFCRCTFQHFLIYYEVRRHTVFYARQHRLTTPARERTHNGWFQQVLL